MLLSILIFLGKTILVIVGLTLLYFLMAILLSWIPLHWKFKNQKEGIEIFVTTNGVHTDFVLPVQKLNKEWLKIIDLNHFEYFKNKELNHLAFGWGDRGFYLDIPTWADLTVKIAANAILIPSPTLMHIKGYKTLPKELKQVEKLTITSLQFEKLCAYISKSFYRDAKQETVFLEGKGYSPNDHFYEAKGSYHLFNTCNYWVNRGLRKIGVRTALWSPLDKGIFYQLKKLSNRQSEIQA